MPSPSLTPAKLPTQHFGDRGPSEKPESPHEQPRPKAEPPTPHPGTCQDFPRDSPQPAKAARRADMGPQHGLGSRTPTAPGGLLPRTLVIPNPLPAPAPLSPAGQCLGSVERQQVPRPGTTPCPQPGLAPWRAQVLTPGPEPPESAHPMSSGRGFPSSLPSRGPGSLDVDASFSGLPFTPDQEGFWLRGSLLG